MTDECDNDQVIENTLLKRNLAVIVDEIEVHVRTEWYE